MDLKAYLVVIDTTEERFLRTVGKGILNSHIIIAESDKDARLEFLKLFVPNVSEQIKNSIYVYDINTITENLKGIQKGPKVFSHIPLSGGRPPKQVSDELVALQEQQQKVNVSQQAQRSSVPHPSPVTQNSLTPDKMKLIREVGALPLPSNSSSGMNPRINASTGLSDNVSERMVTNAPQRESISKNDVSLLNNLGVNLNEYSNNIDVVDKDIKAPIINEELMSINDEKPMTSAELEALQKQVRE